MRVYLDKRSVGKDGRCPLRLVIWKDGKKAMPLTGIRVAPGDWDGTRSRDARLNVRIKDILNNAEDVELLIKQEGRYSSMDINGLVSEIRRKALMTEPSSSRRRNDLLLARMEEYRDRQVKDGTRDVYQRTIDILLRFDPKVGDKTLAMIDYAYLCGFERWCIDKGLKTNTISIYIRNIRTVFNDAISSGLNVQSPFPRFKIRQESTPKRSMTRADIQRLAAMPLPDNQSRYRDYFLLMFFLIGINTVDLFTARPEQLSNGRLYYKRAKTGKEYSIKVEPEAMSIIERYRGKRYLLEPMDSHDNFLSWRTQLNNRLKALGAPTGEHGKIVGSGVFPYLSTYWSRHSWATIAYEIGIPVDIIAQALGHSDRTHTVTMIYIKPDEKKVDDANRKVIDYISPYNDRSQADK